MSQSLDAIPRSNALSTDGPVAIQRRRIGLEHMAFLRGVFEGLPIGALAEQYLIGLSDKRRAKSTLRWLLDELGAAARKRQDAAGARLLKLPLAAFGMPTRTAEKAATPPIAPAKIERPSIASGTTTETLDEFRERFDPDGVYSELELTAFYEEHRPAALMEPALSPKADTAQVDGNTIHPQSASSAPYDLQKTRADRRRVTQHRLRQRRRDLLDRLEAALAEPPHMEHAVGDWLDPAVAIRLERAQIRTLRELFHRIEGGGYRWYRHIPRVGERAAQRIQLWLAMNAKALGRVVPAHAALPRRQWSEATRTARKSANSGVVPLEYFIPDDPGYARDRETLCSILAVYRDRAVTFRCYRSHAERLLLWCAHVRHCRLSEIGHDDARAYLAFLAAPPPAWCGPKAERGTSAWRPFEQGLADTSIQVGHRALRAIFATLRREGYLSNDPFAFSAAKKTPVKHDAVSDSLSLPTVSSRPLPRVGKVMHAGSSGTSLDDARMEMVIALVDAFGPRLADLVEWRLGDWQHRAWAGSAGHASTHAMARDPSSDAALKAVRQYQALRQTDHPLCENDYLLGRHDIVRNRSAAAGRTELDRRVPARAIDPDTLSRALSLYLRRRGIAGGASYRERRANRLRRVASK